MRILVTGCNGQLGREIARQGHNHELVLTDFDTLDITNGAAVTEYFREVKATGRHSLCGLYQCRWC